MSKSKPIRIFVDHWEDYESIGDRAMLLNAMRRLELHLGPCQFVSPLSPKKAGKFQFPNLITVTPPYQEVNSLSAWLRAPYAKLTELLPARLMPKISASFFLEVALALTDFKLVLYSVGLRSVFRKSFRAYLEELSKCDVFFTVGDCSLSDYWLDGIRLKSWLLKLVRRYVSVSVLSSQGIGPLTAPWARKRLVGALKHLDILSFRDFSNSQALVESEGLTGVPYRIVADEAFSYPVASHTEVWETLRARGVSENEAFIVVNFRNTDFTQSTTHLLDRIADLLDGVIAATNKKVVFIPMSSGNDYGCDYEAGRSLKKMMLHSDKFQVLEPIPNIEFVKGIIGAAAYSIGISYHLHVFSLSQGHPTLIVYTGAYYKTKSDGLISFYEPPCRSVNFAETGVEQTLSYVMEIERDYTAACERVREVNQRIMEHNDWTIQTLKKILIEKDVLPG
jgi:polysaccharide pyruvyl transferase WcaK-like protein